MSIFKFGKRVALSAAMIVSFSLLTGCVFLPEFPPRGPSGKDDSGKDPALVAQEHVRDAAAAFFEAYHATFDTEYLEEVLPSDFELHRVYFGFPVEFPKDRVINLLVPSFTQDFAEADGDYTATAGLIDDRLSVVLTGFDEGATATVEGLVYYDVLYSIPIDESKPELTKIKYRRRVEAFHMVLQNDSSWQITQLVLWDPENDPDNPPVITPIIDIYPEGPKVVGDEIAICIGFENDGGAGFYKLKSALTVNGLEILYNDNEAGGNVYYGQVLRGTRDCHDVTLNESGDYEVTVDVFAGTESGRNEDLHYSGQKSVQFVVD